MANEPISSLNAASDPIDPADLLTIVRSVADGFDRKATLAQIRNVGTTAGKVPVYAGSNKAVDITEINGLVSHPSDTSVDTTAHICAVVGSIASRAASGTSLPAGVSFSRNSVASNNYASIDGSNECNASGVGSYIAGSFQCNATNERTSIIGSNTTDVTGFRSSAVSADDCTVSGANSSVHSCLEVTCSGGRSVAQASTASANAGDLSLIHASASCETTTDLSYQVIIGSQSCTTSAARAAVLFSQGVLNSTGNTLAMGVVATSTPATANKKFSFDLANGNFRAAGTVLASQTFADVAELLPNITGEAIPMGTVVVADGNGVRPSTSEDDPLDIAGVITQTAALLMGDSSFCWTGRYLMDEFGGKLLETVKNPAYGNDPETPGAEYITQPRENPQYDPEMENVPRSERPDDWSPVGLLGRVLVRVHSTIVCGQFVQPGGMVGTRRTCLRILDTHIAYDQTPGYGVAICLLK